MKSREFVRKHLLPAGAVLVKKHGDHHVFLLPNGKKIQVPMGGGQTEIAPALVAKFNRYMKEGK